VCDKPDARIQSCQTAGTQFLIQNQKFNVTYQQCEGMEGTFTGTVEFSCLGDWFVGLLVACVCCVLCFAIV